MENKTMKINGSLREIIKFVVLLAAIIASFYGLKADVKILDNKMIQVQDQQKWMSDRMDRIESRIDDLKDKP